MLKVFSSDHPKVMEVWNSLDDAHGAWVERVREWEAQVGNRAAVERYHNEALVIRGVLDNPGDDKGWQPAMSVEQKPKMMGFWEPNRSNHVGRKHERDIKALRWNVPDLPGMPKTWWTAEGRLYRYGIEAIKGVVWVTWGTKDVEVDLELWEERTENEWIEARAALDEGLSEPTTTL